MSSFVRIEDYYSDQDYPPPAIGRHGNNQRSTSSNRSSPSRSNHSQRQQQPPPMLRKGRPGQPRQYYQPIDDDDLTGSEEEDDEQELSSAMHNLGFHDRPPVARYPGGRPAFQRSNSDYEYIPQNRYDHDHDFSPYGPPVPPYLMQNSRYHPPPPPPPLPLPPAQWMPYQPMMLDDMSPRMGPVYRPQPFVRRSASSRSYNRHNNGPTSSSRRQEMFMSHDEDSELEDQDFYYEDDDNENDQEAYSSANPPPLSRQDSTGNRNGPRPFPRKRSNSMSAMPLHPAPFMMESSRRQAPANYFYPPPPPSYHYQQGMNPRFSAGVRFPPPRLVHSVPSSPQLSVSSDSGSEDYPPQHPPSRRASINVAPQVNRPNGRVGRSMSFSGGFPPHGPINMAPPPPPPPAAAGAAAPMPPMVLHPLPPQMAHPMMENASRSNSIYGLPSGAALGGDFFDQMTSKSATAPVTPIDNPPSASGSTSGDIPMNPQVSQQSQHPSGMAPNMQQQQPLSMPMPPPPPPQQMHPWVSGFPTSPGDPSMFGNQQGMMQQHPPQMMLPAMFNNPMMSQNTIQNAMWNFMPDMMLGQNGALGGDFPLPFMYSSDPNLIAQAMGGPVSGGGPNFGGPGAMDGNNNMHSPRMNMSGNPSEGQNGNKGSGSGGNGGPSHEEDMMRRAAAGGSGKEPPHGHDTMMTNFAQPAPSNTAPMLKRGLSMLGGLFSGNGGGGGGGGANRRREDFHGPHPMFGSFSAPIQAQSKKEARLQRQYEKLGTFYCWRRMDIPDQPFESFSIKNQYIIRKKIRKLGPQAQFMLKSDERLPGVIMVNLHQNRGGCLMNMGGEKVVVMLQIERKSFGTSNYIFGGGGEGHLQGPPGQW
ncbi:hypothetical protein [Parasitella parasitica]|uniref:Uncharacterized protein n=1 Tax=Parasitella parasitica TaxID=35722 RepID=A0A0B7NMY6_9FUNG|nr:hypothetical protein [Parasitella parasitica]